MSLQIQSSQQPTAPSSGGRRTPQVYQNLATAGGGNTGTAAGPTSGVSPPAPTNGNSGKTSKLSLKASGKQQQANPSVVAPAPQQPDVIVIDPVPPKEILKGVAASSNVVISVAKLPAGGANGNSNGKHDEVKPAAPVTPKKDEVVVEVKEKKAKNSPRATPQKQQLAQATESIPVEHVKTPESAGKKGAASKDTTPTVVTPENKKKAAPDTSLAAEKTLKGFTAEGDEMESLVVEPSEYEDSPMPPRTGGKSKLLKYGGAPPTRARISPFRVNAAANAAAAAAAANLSTVSEGQSTESNEASPAVPPADFNRPLRAISGRRSTRPLTDIQFTYRKSADLNDSSSSLNVTVGSEIHNDSLRTPGVSGSSRKRKNMTPESTSDALDVQEHIDSPKRTRLDFSGFLGIVASPVTMLKNRFSRVRLATSSTPVAKRSYDEEDLATCVTAEATTTTANISGGQPGGAGGDAKMEVEPAETTPAAEGEKKDEETTTTSTPKDGQTDPADASVADEAKEEDDAVEVKDLTDKQQRRCVIM